MERKMENSMTKRERTSLKKEKISRMMRTFLTKKRKKSPSPPKNLDTKYFI